MGWYPAAPVGANPSGTATVGGSAVNGSALTFLRSDSVLPITNPKIDALAAGDDNTTLNTSTAKHGLCPKLDGTATNFLNGTGVFSAPASGDQFTPTANATTSSGAATANGKRGRITIAAGDAALNEFTITNSYVAAGTTIMVCASSNQSALLQNARPGSGSFVVEFNNPPGSGATFDFLVVV